VTGIARAVFLDRDGTLIRDPGYLKDSGAVEVLPGVRAALERLAQAGYLLVVVTNQSGIGRGYFTEEEYREVTAAFVRELAVGLTAIYHCPHAPEENCTCRKPAPDLLFRAAAEYDIDLDRSWMIGDREWDSLAGLNAGCRAVQIGEAPAPTGVPLAPDLAAAVDVILDSEQ